ncbi:MULTISPECIES: DUF2635 domain-containing protein [unclassified Oceanobacter]|uniref:DUF2635 domain-containing protein n=1 Tax=unclassified Oceanobacter TaxID=2620260 RepID=UPI00273520E5|nr:MULTISPECIES: DUF2635 domain-containing protein [unclassified Oceanobacter]MDP2548483.1 DUF2635 domain-containing protein [Oceanobacter sp. 4_MG-2023]MDP2607946.1 DUF2635 domain-containing protein [Oceanobacter sp. 1_MG-2023]MDP2611392.1 DUF2635 domain-containing protein [Oceanobacter sp. 2_MG-2023]
MSRLNVKPAPGKQVRTETGAVIATGGQQVQDNSYYRRRIKDGDLVLVKSKSKTGASK